MHMKKYFVIALLSGLAAVSFAQTSATGATPPAHSSHKKAASASKAKPAHHKAKRAKKHHSTRQHSKKKVHAQRGSNTNKSGSAGPGLQAY